MLGKLQKILKSYWGYDDFRSLQKEAMLSVAEDRDSVVVLPTGGGKSLCFQAPAVLAEGTAIVVSPLISLMKDQVDALQENGVPAARLDSSIPYWEQDLVYDDIESGELKILYLAPERLCSDNFVNILKTMKISFFAIDEAHCISMWGHDFRPEYRRLGELREVFPKVSFHAYTATATERVQEDIAKQLRLKNPEILVGSFDRPNLHYKVYQKSNIFDQVARILERHKNESGIVYCIRRDDVEEMCFELQKKGYHVASYHAGMEKEDRKINQDRFIDGELDAIVATVAFGMGIDKPNVRFVTHSGMPKSLEHYQQESGRAGRDDLEAECTLFYSGADYGTWRRILEYSMEGRPLKIAIDKLNEMYNYCRGVECRHAALLHYFGQELESDNCGACDICLEELEQMEDSLVTAQKILSCVVRLEEMFGAIHTAKVLMGSEDSRVLERGHDTLSTYGLLADFKIRDVRNWIEQLIAQGFLKKVGEFKQLKVTDKGWRAIRGKEEPKLLAPVRRKKKQKVKKSAAAIKSWEGVDEGLFEELRSLRLGIAKSRDLPAFVIFGDESLREMARIRPTTKDAFLHIKGVGKKKNKQYGAKFIQAITNFCIMNDLETDVGITEDLKKTVRSQSRKVRREKRKQHAFELFQNGHTIREACMILDTTPNRVLRMLLDYIAEEGLKNPEAWVDKYTFQRVLVARQQLGRDNIRGIFKQLEGQVDIPLIKISLACFRNF